MGAIGSALKDGFLGIILGLDGIIYRLIGWLYQLFIVISSARIFTSETFEVFEERIYIILGIGMLFLLAYSLLRSIADPEGFASGNYSMGKIVMNTITSLILIAVMPTIFNFAYTLQQRIVEDNIIGKIILGSYSSPTSSLVVTYENEEECEALGESSTPCQRKYSDSSKTNLRLAGNSIATDIYSAFYYPEVANKVGTTSKDVMLYEIPYNSVGEKFSEKNDALFSTISSYNNCSQEYKNEEDEEEVGSYLYGPAIERCALASELLNDIEVKNTMIYYRSLLQYTKTTGSFAGFGLIRQQIWDDKIDYSWFITTIAGGACIYVFLSYCLDMGLRAAKLGFAQLIAPIPIFARILPSKANMFASWRDFTIKTFLDVFTRLAIIFLGIFMVTNLPDFTQLWDESLFSSIAVGSLKLPLIMDLNVSYGVLGFARVVVIIGILMFMKQAPDLLQQALGININTGSLSIKDKLNGMWGVDKLKQSKILGAASGAIGAGYMSARNGGGFWRAALKGGVEGHNAGGMQLRNQGQRTYHDLTGDKYNGSFLRRGRSFMGNVNAQYDSSNRQLREDNLQHMKDTVSNFESSEEFKRLKASKMQENHHTELEQIRIKQEQSNAEASRVNQQAIAEANEIKNNAKQQADDYKINEAKAVSDRMKNYQNNAEYNNIKHIAQGLAAQEAGYATMSADEQQKIIDKYLKQELSKSDSEGAKQYLKDMTRDINKEADEIIQKANAEANEKITEARKTYQEALDTARKEANNALAKLDETVEEEVAKEIKKNPKGRAQVAYANAMSEVERGEKVKKNRDMMDAFDQFYRDNGRNNNNNNGGNNNH